MHHAGIVDQDGDGAERPLGTIECMQHGLAVDHIGADGDGAPARVFDARLDLVETVGTARHQSHRGAGPGQYLGEPHPEPARCAGDQRDPAGEVEKVRCIHSSSPRKAGTQ